MDFLKRVNKIQGKNHPPVEQSEVKGWGLINVELRPHQLVGVKWLIERQLRNHGCILGDEMGLGKTLQVLMYKPLETLCRLKCTLFNFRRLV